LKEGILVSVFLGGGRRIPPEKYLEEY